MGNVEESFRLDGSLDGLTDGDEDFEISRAMGDEDGLRRGKAIAAGEGEDDEDAEEANFAATPVFEAFVKVNHST